MDKKLKNKIPYFVVSKSPLGGVFVEIIGNDIKNKCNWVKDYFDDLRMVIRDIREGEKDYYAKIREIIASCSVDYNPHNTETRQFFSTMQNKLLWAVTGKTAAEIIIVRAHAEKPFMGVSTWKNGPKGKIRKADLYIAKNYLTAREIHDLEHLTTMFLDYVLENLRELHPLTLADWSDVLDKFLRQVERDLMPEEEGRIIYMVEEIIEKEYKDYCCGNCLRQV
ncbi:MAG: virulence RhuM family protein [Spirochaetales bacterium]|nr:virulence RhuM family protein [Spirochaetales bacterium]